MSIISSKLHVFGPYRGPTGYDSVVRNATANLYMKGIRFSLEHFDYWTGIKIPDLEDIYEVFEKNLVVPEIQLNFCLPEQIPLNHSRINAIYTMFESDRIPELWVDCCNQADLVMVPTEFCKQAWINSGVVEPKIKVVPLGVDTTTFRPDVNSLPLNTRGQGSPFDYEHRFMVVQEVSDRKNLEGVLRAWLTAFPDDGDGVCLILKISDFSSRRTEKLTQLIKELRKELNVQGAPIFAFSWVYSNTEMPNFLAAATHYFTMTRGEGWDLTCHSMMAMGKQTIVPAHTSYPEYTNLNTSFLIPSEITLCKQSGSTARLYHNGNWFEPNVERAAELLRESIKSPKDKDEIVKQAEKFTWKKTAEGIIKELEEAYSVDKSIPYQKSDKTEGLLVCKTLGQECGIANYAQTLQYHFDTEGKHSFNHMVVSGEDYNHICLTDKNRINFVHIQHEYQFYSPVRLKKMLREWRARGVKTIVTQHTFNRQAVDHNDILYREADIIITHSEQARAGYQSLGYNGNKVKVIRMGCLPPYSKLAEPPEDVFLVGFFGFSYYHKGIHKLILAVNELQRKGHKIGLIILSRKPQQDRIGYYEYCQRLLIDSGMMHGEHYEWHDRYLSEKQIVGALQQCHIIMLPYDDYGGIGISAAGKTCMRALRPMVVSDTCWFGDIDEYTAPRIERFGGVRQAIENHLHGYDFKPWSDAIHSYVTTYTMERTAKEHKELYDRISRGQI